MGSGEAEPVTPSLTAPRRRQAGMALLAVLVVLVVIAGSSAAFIWSMNGQQRRAGIRLREAAARSAAEAGVYRALAILETTAPDGSAGRSWRTSGHTEALRGGALERRFSVSVADGPGGTITITSAGGAGGIERRLRARVHLAGPALLSALYGSGIIHLARPPAAFLVVPYGLGIRDRSWVHVAAARGVEFATPDVSINEPRRAFAVDPGPLDAPGGAGNTAAAAAPGPLRFLLGRGASLMIGPDRQPVNVQQLRAYGVPVEGAIIDQDQLPPLPVVDAAYFRALASANTLNDDLNRSAGRYAGDDALSRKSGSVYAHVEFEQLAAYLRSGHAAVLRGVVYLEGGLSLTDGQSLRVVDGSIVAESTVFLGRGATLEVIHTPAARALPGLLVLGDGGLVVTQDAHLRVHGLVYVSRTADIGVGARVDVVGAILANDPEISFRSYGGTVVVRYDPAVLGTPGLDAVEGAPVVAWVATWEEMP
jgi:type II secretory pathway pseudopilin PulG